MEDGENDDFCEAFQFLLSHQDNKSPVLESVLLNNR